MAINVVVSQVGLQGAVGSPGQDAETTTIPSASRILFFDDFITSTSAGDMDWASSNSAGGAISSQDSESNHSGILRFTTGSSSASAYANIHLGTDSIYVGNGQITVEMLIRINTLSTSSERYILRLGMGDVTNAVFQNGVWFEYNESSDSNWYRCAANAASATQTQTSTSVSAGSWIKLKFVINSNGTSVEYFINGSSVGTVTTNIPVTTSPRLHIVKTIGTTARTFDIDYYSFDYPLTTSR